LKTCHEFAKRAEIIQKAHVTLFPFLAIFLDRDWLILDCFLLQCSVDFVVTVESLIEIPERIKSRRSWFDRLDDSSRKRLADGEFLLCISIISRNKIFFSLLEWLRLSAEVENILLLLRNLFLIRTYFSLKAVLKISQLWFIYGEPLIKFLNFIFKVSN